MTWLMSVAALQQHQKAVHEVAVCEDYIDRLLSVHKECGPGWDWEAIRSCDPPAEPKRSDAHRRQACQLLDAFQPNLVDKLLGRVESKRHEFAQAVQELQRKTNGNTVWPWTTIGMSIRNGQSCTTCLKRYSTGV